MRRIRRGGVYFRIAEQDWTDPFDGAYSARQGGRWNPPGSFPVVYLNRDLQTSRANLDRKFVGLPYGPELLKPEEAPILIQTTVQETDYVDIITDSGCLAVGLPQTYPFDDNNLEIGWDRCQPIGIRAWEGGEAGIACRSAAARDYRGEELAFFVRIGQELLHIERRIPFEEWR